MSDGTLTTIPTETRPADNANRRWRRWEIGALLDILQERGSLEDVGIRLGRSTDAVRREYDRILSGQMPCPAEYVQSLEALKKRLAPRALKEPETEEQYLGLAQQMRRSVESLNDLRAINIASLAMLVANGALPAQSLLSILSHRTGMAVIRMARDLQQKANAPGRFNMPTDQQVEEMARAEAMNKPDPFEIN